MRIPFHNRLRQAQTLYNSKDDDDDDDDDENDDDDDDDDLKAESSLRAPLV